jgi:hypothetical protein
MNTVREHLIRTPEGIAQQSKNRRVNAILNNEISCYSDEFA